MPITDMALSYDINRNPAPPRVVYPEFMTKTNPFGFGKATGPAGMMIVTWYNKDTGESYVAPNTGYRPPKGQEGSWTTQQPTNWKDISAGKTPVEGWGKRPEPEPTPVSGIQWGDPLSGDYVKGPAPDPSPSPSPTSGVVPRQTITTGGARISDQGPMPAPTATIPQDPRYNLPTYVVPGEGKVALPGMAQGGAVEDHVDIMRSIGIDPKGEVTPEQLDRFNREYNDFLDKRRQKEENWDYEFKEHDAVLARGFSKGGSVTQYDQLFFEKGKEFGVDPMILKGIASVESNFNPKAVGPKTRYGNAQGMMQFIPAMQKPYGITDPFDPEQSVAGSARMMRDLLKRYKGDVGKALEAYNGGPRLVGKSTQTRKYAEKVQRKAQLFAKSTQKPAIEVAGTATQGPSALSRTPQVSQQTPKFNVKPKTGELTASLDDLGNEYKAAIALTYLSEDDSDGLTITERAEQLLADQEEDSTLRGDALSQIFTMEPTETAEADPFDVYAAVQNPQPEQAMPQFNQGGFVFGGTSLPGMPNTYLEPVGQLTPEVKRILEEIEPANKQYEQEVEAYNQQLEQWQAKAEAYNKAVDDILRKEEIANKYIDFYNAKVIPAYGESAAPEFNTWLKSMSGSPIGGYTAPMFGPNDSLKQDFENTFGFVENPWARDFQFKDKVSSVIPKDMYPSGNPDSWQASLPTKPEEFSAAVPNLGYDPQQYQEKLAPLRRAQENVAKYGQERELALAVASNPDAYNLAGFGMAEGGAVDKRTALDRVRDFLQAMDVTPLDALYAVGRTGAGMAIGLTPSGLNEGEDELLAKYRAMAERERSTPQPPMARSEGSPPYGEDVDMQMFGSTGDRSMDEAKKGLGRSVDAIRRGVQYSPADLLGAPVDVINMVLDPIGLGSEKPFMGSEYLIDKGVQAGIYEKPTGEGEETLARFAAGMINPTLGPRAVGKAAEGIESLTKTPPTGAITPQPIQSSYLVPSENKPFVSNVERFVLDLPDKVTKQQVLGQFKKLGRKHEIARLEMALEDFPDDARLDTTRLLARLEQNSPRRYTTEIIEPDRDSNAFSHTNIKLFHQTDMPFSFNFDTQQTRNVGSVNLLLDPNKEQSELIDAALTLKDAKYMLSSVDMFLPSKESYTKMDHLSQAVDVLRQYDSNTAKGMSSVLGRARQLADKSKDIVKLSNAVTSPDAVKLHELTFNQGIPRDQAKLQLAIEPAAKLQELLLDLNVGLPGTNYAEFDNLRLGMREGRVSHDQVKEFVTDVLGKGVENEIALVKDQLKGFTPLVMPRFNKNLENVMPYMGKPQHTDIAPRNPISFSRFTDLTPDEVTSSVPFEKGAMAFSELQSDRWSDLAKAKKLNKDVGIEEPFPNMADNYGLVQQLAAKNAIYAAVKRDKDMVLFPSVDSKKPELYEGLLPSLKAVVKDLGPGFRLAKTQVAGNRPIVVDRDGNILEVKYDEPPIERLGIKIEPEGAERIKSEGIRFAKGGIVDKPLYDRAA